MSDCFDHFNDAMDSDYGDVDREYHGRSSRQAYHYQPPKCLHCGATGSWVPTRNSWCLHVGGQPHVCHIRLAKDFEDLDK